MTRPDHDRIAALWQDIRTHLETTKRAVTMEIRAYPQPIAGCDAQIPALWERRDALVRELDRLEVAAKIGTPEALETFIDAASCIDEETQRAFRDRLVRVAAPAAAE